LIRKEKTGVLFPRGPDEVRCGARDRPFRHPGNCPGGLWWDKGCWKMVDAMAMELHG